MAENEIVLSAFAGMCFVCNKCGHKAHKCPDKKGNAVGGANPRGRNPNANARRFSGNCNKCGRMGHKHADCWQLEENKDKRPNGFKLDNEQANSNVDSESRTEYTLCDMNINTTPKLLTDPNLWIADSTATVHTLPYDVGMHDAVVATSNDAITVGNGQNVKANKVASITGICCDKHVNKLGQATLTDVTHLPGGMFNLFRLTKMLKVRWILDRYSQSVWLTKGEEMVTFDIKIPTNKGKLLAMYFKRST